MTSQLGPTNHIVQTLTKDPCNSWEATNIALWFVASLCTFVEIAKYFAEALTPWTMLFTHVIKLTCALATLVLDIVVYVQKHDKHYSLVALGLDCGFM